eukprot:scaffold1748_cov164-Amphora_coffeaeformis.AAC.2
MGHPTGRTINWVVYEKEGTCDELTDDEIGLFNPKCPKERWQPQTREHPVGTLVRKTFNDVEYIGCVQGHVKALRINDDDSCNGNTVGVSDKCERNTNDMAVSDANKRKGKAKGNTGGIAKEADAKPSAASLPQIETKSSNIVTTRGEWLLLLLLLLLLLVCQCESPNMDIPNLTMRVHGGGNRRLVRQPQTSLSSWNRSEPAVWEESKARCGSRLSR